MVNRAAGCVFVHSELLCFLQSNFGCLPKDNLISSISGFYSADVIVAAKKLLFDTAETVVADAANRIDVPRYVKRRGDSQQRADAIDMTELWAMLDDAHIILPSFIAVNSKQLPPTYMTESEMCVLLAECHGDENPDERPDDRSERCWRIRVEGARQRHG